MDRHKSSTLRKPMAAFDDKAEFQEFEPTTRKPTLKKYADLIL